ncbi:hypothetical protein [Naasia aerilata]|uniref:hypothetical protein n=1 Tax=Naasia aerilata TaxID=1162966 RepID=UPI0025747325|nr:hypothetical protein [Naasia aerilata]
MSFGNREFAIPNSADISGLKQEILAAVRAGGGYVTLPRSESRKGSLEVLFTAGIPLQWEEVEFSEEDATDLIATDSGHDTDY